MDSITAKLEEQKQISSDIDSLRSLIKGMFRIVKLREEGEITQEEFERKCQLLERIGGSILN